MKKTPVYSNEGLKKQCAKKKKKFICKFMTFILAVTGITLVIGKTVEFVKNAQNSKNNISSEMKKYFSFFSAKRLMHTNQFVSGIVACLNFSATTISVVGSNLKEDSVISVTSNASAVKIIVPENVNVIVDGLYNKSVVTNSTDNELPDAKKLYIVIRSNFSAIKIERAALNK